jgi:site-specific DNA-methyltransferase (adenine-specific)
MNGQGPAMGAEMFVCAWAGKGHARWNAGGKRGVYTFSTNPTDRDGRHPTEKPWRLMHALIKDFTSSDQLICDPFMGSGSTLVAAAKHRRPAIGIERDPTYFEVACERVAKAYEGNDFFIPSVEPLRQTDIMDMVEAANV